MCFVKPKKILYVLFSLAVFIYVSIYYDNIIIAPNSSLLRKLDIVLFKFLGKQIIYVSLGSDSRPPFLSGKYKDENDERFNLSEILDQSRRVKKSVEFYEKFSDYFVSYPQHLSFNNKSVINGMCIGFPQPPSVLDNRNKQHKTYDVIRIIHAPSRPNAKGSKDIRRIIEELKREGFNIEFKELRNSPNKKVLEELNKSDILVDELYSDLPLGGLGVEAACNKIPVVSCGYYQLDKLKETSPEEIPPSLYIHPLELKDNLIKLCKSNSLRKQIGDSLFTFVSNHWSSKNIAAKYLQILNGQINEKWKFGIDEIDYINGWGLSENELVENLNGFDSIY